jgi:hypothetical protein
MNNFQSVSDARRHIELYGTTSSHHRCEMEEAAIKQISAEEAETARAVGALARGVGAPLGMMGGSLLAIGLIVAMFVILAGAFVALMVTAVWIIMLAFAPREAGTLAIVPVVAGMLLGPALPVGFDTPLGFVSAPDMGGQIWTGAIVWTVVLFAVFSFPLGQWSIQGIIKLEFVIAENVGGSPWRKALAFLPFILSPTILAFVVLVLAGWTDLLAAGKGVSLLAAIKRGIGLLESGFEERFWVILGIGGVLAMSQAWSLIKTFSDILNASRENEIDPENNCLTRS